MPAKPLLRAYWVDKPRVMAGAYPGDRDPAIAEAKIRKLLDAGVRTIINLMEPDERDHRVRLFVPYMPVVEPLAAARNITVDFHQFPVRDLCAPTAAQAEEILALMDAPRDGAVFVHCWGGRGRTGTIVGCYLIRKGLATAENYVDIIRELRTKDAGQGSSPETQAQLAFVHEFTRGVARP